MARLLAADIHPDGAHPLGHIAVADPGAVQPQAAPGQESLQPQIGHHGRDDRRRPPAARRRPGARDQRQDLVAVDQLPVLVGQQHPVGIAVQRDAQIGAVRQHLLAQRAPARSSRSRG